MFNVFRLWFIYDSCELDVSGCFLERVVVYMESWEHVYWILHWTIIYPLMDIMVFLQKKNPKSLWFFPLLRNSWCRLNDLGRWWRGFRGWGGLCVCVFVRVLELSVLFCVGFENKMRNEDMFIYYVLVEILEIIYLWLLFNVLHWGMRFSIIWWFI